MPLTEALTRLRDAALALLARLTQAAPAPRQAAAERRAHSALQWLAALTSILSGERLYHRPVRVPPPDNLPAFLFAPDPRAPRPKQPRTEAQRAQSRAAGRLAYIRRSFATIPTATIATRIARRLGLTQADAAWPHALTEIAEPPATHALYLHPTAAAPPKLPSVFAALRAADRWTRYVQKMLAAPREQPDTC